MSQIKVDSIVPSSGLPSGAYGGIIQVVSTFKNDTFTTTSNSWTDITGLSVTISPSTTSSKILVSFSIDYSSTSNNSCRVSIFNGSTNLLGSDVSNRLRGFQCYTWSDTNTSEQANFQLLDSPTYSSGASITYQVKIAIQAGTGCINRSGSDNDDANYGYRSASSITAMQIAI